MYYVGKKRGGSVDFFEETGKWWLPSDCDNKVSGILRFDPEKGVKLELFDSLNMRKSRRTRYNDQIPYEDIILGETSGDVTLYECYQVGLKEFNVSVVFHDHHFANEEDIEFDRITITYPNLDTWVGKNGFVKLEKQLDNGQTEEFFGYKPPDEIKARINNLEIKISFDFTYLPNPPSEKRLIQGTKIEIKADEKIHFNEYHDKILFLLYQFLSLGIGKAVYPLNINGFNEFFRFKIFRTEINPPIKIFHEIGRFSPMEKILGTDMLFTFNDISDDFEKYLNNWFEKAEDLEWVYNLYSATILDKSMLLEHKFLSLAQALESYHQRAYTGKYMTKGKYKKVKKGLLLNIPKNLPIDLEENLKSRIINGNYYSFKSRLFEIYEDYSEIMDLVISEKETFIDDLKNTRNFFTHFGKSLEEKAKTEDDLVNLTDQIKCMLEVCFLAELGLPLNKIKEIIARNKTYKYLKN